MDGGGGGLLPRLTAPPPFLGCSRDEYIPDFAVKKKQTKNPKKQNTTNLEIVCISSISALFFLLPISFFFFHFSFFFTFFIYRALECTVCFQTLFSPYFSFNKTEQNAKIIRCVIFKKKIATQLGKTDKHMTE